MENIHIIGSEVIDGKETGEHGIYSLDGLCYINNYNPLNKKTSAPLFNTRKGNYGHTRTYDSTKHAFRSTRFIQLDSGLLVNVDEICDIEKIRYGGYIAHFGEGVTSIHIAENKGKLDIIRNFMRKA